MYTYLLILALYGADYPPQNQPTLSLEQCVSFGEAMKRASPNKDTYYYVCAPIEASMIDSSAKPVYGLASGTVYGGGNVPAKYGKVKLISK